ncbi:MAG TPA: AGE family epimerase/isomerase [Opitutaceae bacterium]|nr:AGE family epimerase/isomerase [Opitutaceae bacterium]
MQPQTRLDYITRIEQELRENILPFWMKYGVDRERGGLHGEVGADLTVKRDAERGALLSTRVLWTFSAAHRHYPQKDYLQTATWAYEDLIKRFWDQENGGLYWSGSADGKPLRTRKQVYGQAFGIYAMSEYFKVTKDRTALDRAIRIFELLETHCRDTVHGGYLEAFTAEWGALEDMRLSEVDMNEPKSQNTHLHVLEGYTNLLRVWPNDKLREAQRTLIDTMLTRILDAKTFHLGLFFDLQWNWKTDRISFGHDIEAAWLLHEAAQVVGDAAQIARVREVALGIAKVTYEQSLDSDGALLYEADAKGITQTYKEWWVQAEAAVGFLDAYQIGRDEKYLKTALHLWDFIEAKLVDRKGGEWFRNVSREGAPSGEPKISFWKCPYHNGRACLELADRLKAL